MSALAAFLLGALAPLLMVAVERRRSARLRTAVLDAVHELARPLTAVRMGIRALAPEAECRLDSELERARSSLHALTGAVGGSADRSPEHFAAADLLRDVAEVWSLIAARAGRSLEVRTETGSMLTGDRGQLGQALVNLIANSLQHGSGSISMSALDRPGGCRIEVCDEGPARDSFEDGRSGRGLRIVGRTVAVHGGSLDCSRLGDGAVALDLPGEAR